jgi:hypothetical protein
MEIEYTIFAQELVDHATGSAGAFCERYRDALAAELAHAFHGADVTVSIDHELSGAVESIRVTDEDEDGDDDYRTREAAEDRVQQIADDLCEQMSRDDWQRGSSLREALDQVDCDDDDQRRAALEVIDHFLIGDHITAAAVAEKLEHTNSAWAPLRAAFIAARAQ